MPDLSFLAIIAAISAMISAVCLTIAYHVPPELRDAGREMIERIEEAMRQQRDD